MKLRIFFQNIIFAKGCVQESYSLPKMHPIRPTPIYENQILQYMRSAFSTLYLEESCGTEYHNCCSIVREHERRIEGLEQVLESLQRSNKKVLCLVACILCSLMLYSKILQLL